MAPAARKAASQKLYLDAKQYLGLSRWYRWEAIRMIVGMIETGAWEDLGFAKIPDFVASFDISPTTYRKYSNVWRTFGAFASRADVERISWQKFVIAARAIDEKQVTGPVMALFHCRNYNVEQLRSKYHQGAPANIWINKDIEYEASVSMEVITAVATDRALSDAEVRKFVERLCREFAKKRLAA